MHTDSWHRYALLALTVAFAAPLSAQGHVHSARAGPGTSVPTVAGPYWHAPASLAWHPAAGAASSELLRPTVQAPTGGARLPRWVRWGIVGAAAGAVTLPLLGSLASGDRAHPARDAVAGAAAGFVIVGGSVALWDVVCRGPTRSRRAGLCGRR